MHGYLNYRGVDTYYIELPIKLGDSVQIIDGKKIYMLYDFKREVFSKSKFRVHANHPKLKKHPCVNIGCKVKANGKTVSINDYLIKEQEFY